MAAMMFLGSLTRESKRQSVADDDELVFVIAAR
jgi:hypothetical protein